MLFIECLKSIVFVGDSELRIESTIVQERFGYTILPSVEIQNHRSVACSCLNNCSQHPPLILLQP